MSVINEQVLLTKRQSLRDQQVLIQTQLNLLDELIQGFVKESEEEVLKDSPRLDYSSRSKVFRRRLETVIAVLKQRNTVTSCRVLADHLYPIWKNEGIGVHKKAETKKIVSMCLNTLKRRGEVMNYALNGNKLKSYWGMKYWFTSEGDVFPNHKWGGELSDIIKNR